MADIESEITRPGWETLRLIGRGGFGAVYELRRSVFGDTERCALKHISIPQSDSEIREMRSEGLDEQSISRSFTEQAREVAEEYKMMMRLSDCPNVVRCHDVDYTRKARGLGWDVYIRMELLTPLIDILSKQLAFPEEETVLLGRDIANALCACSRLHIIHRDIKPQNIFVAEDCSYKLGDFGIARISERTGSATARIGTFSYMAPEVYNGRQYGAQADIYSLGMVLYWLLNERRAPFVTDNSSREKETALLRRMRGEPIPPPAHGSPWLQRIVLKACAYDPKDRYRNADELLNDLNNAEFGVRNSELGNDGRAPAPVGATFGRPPKAETPDRDRRGEPRGRPPAASTAQRAPEAVGALHEAPASTGPKAAVSAAGAAGGQRTNEPVEADALGGPRPPAPAGAENAEFGIRNSELKKDQGGPAPVGATFGRPPKAETSDRDRRGDPRVLPPAASTAQRAPEVVGALHEAPASTGPRTPAPVGRPPKAETPDRDRRGEPRGRPPVPSPAPRANGQAKPKGPAPSPAGAAPKRPPAAPARPPVEKRPAAEKAKADTASQAGSREERRPRKKRAALVILTVLLGTAALVLFLLRPQYGSWSAWSDEYPEPIDWRKIEASTAYRYCTGTLMSTTDRREVSGEIDHETQEYAAWGEFGDWQEEPIPEKENREVETILQYATARKETMTSGKENMEGWIFLEATSEPAWGGVADAWSTTKPEESDTRQAVEKTQYCPIKEVRRNGEVESSSAGDWSDTMDAGPDGTTLRTWYSGGERYTEYLYYNTRTVYSYRDLGTKTTYHYYRWSDWSDWSFEEAEENENLQVKTRTLYRCREKVEVPVYYYYIWSDWSAWSMEPVQESDTVKVETLPVYRYRDRVN